MSNASHSFAVDQFLRLPNKIPVLVATTSNVANLNGGCPLIVDGLTLVAGIRVLVKEQTLTQTNGIYEVQTAGTGVDGVWVRTQDANDIRGVYAGLAVYVQRGTVNGGLSFVLKTVGTIVLGTTGLTFQVDAPPGLQWNVMRPSNGLTQGAESAIEHDIYNPWQCTLELYALAVMMRVVNTEGTYGLEAVKVGAGTVIVGPPFNMNTLVADVWTPMTLQAPGSGDLKITQGQSMRLTFTSNDPDFDGQGVWWSATYRVL